MIDISQSGNYAGDCRELIKQLPDNCINTCITSPPYWSMRSYFADDDDRAKQQIGMEATPSDWLASMVTLFDEVNRVLRPDGTLWLNIGDCYSSSGRAGPQGATGALATRRVATARVSRAGIHARVVDAGATGRQWVKPPAGTKSKDLIGLPWMLAFALRDRGWYLRADIIWHKPNPIPESVRDRPTKSHEYIFLLSKSPRYYYDADAIRTALQPSTLTTFGTTRRSKGSGDKAGRIAGTVRQPAVKDGRIIGANKRSVWTVASQPFRGAHFATFPPRLVEPCVLAGAPRDGIVLDPFFGSGTVGMVAKKHGRRWIGFDLGYHDIAAKRVANAPSFQAELMP